MKLLVCGVWSVCYWVCARMAGLTKNTRLEAQSSRRNLSKDDFNHELSDKEFKTLLNLCKGGKLSVAQLRQLSQSLSSSVNGDHAQLLLNSDGCLHSLVGYLSSPSDPSKQVLAVQCLVNLAANGYRGLFWRRQLGPTWSL